jgi:hypothetical protein
MYLEKLIDKLQQEAINPTYLLAWIPESLLNEKGSTEWDKFVKIEERAVLDDDDEGTYSVLHNLAALRLSQAFRCSFDRSSDPTS